MNFIFSICVFRVTFQMPILYECLCACVCLCGFCVVFVCLCAMCIRNKKPELKRKTWIIQHEWNRNCDEPKRNSSKQTNCNCFCNTIENHERNSKPHIHHPVVRRLGSQKYSHLKWHHEKCTTISLDIMSHGTCKENRTDYVSIGSGLGLMNRIQAHSYT